MERATPCASTSASRGISPDERARRQAEDDALRTSMARDGLAFSEYSDLMHRRYIDGEITLAELSEAIFAHHGIPTGQGSCADDRHVDE